MSWLNLEAEIAAEFAADDISDVTEAELWRQSRLRAERAHARTQRGGGGIPEVRKCGWCADVLPPVTGARGPASTFCSKSCRNQDSRRRRKELLASSSPIQYGEQHPSPALTGFDPDRNA